jgi:hypothetical protein
VLSSEFHSVGREYSEDFLNSLILGWGIDSRLAFRRSGIFSRSVFSVQVFVNELGQ